MKSDSAVQVQIDGNDGEWLIGNLRMTCCVHLLEGELRWTTYRGNETGAEDVAIGPSNAPRLCVGNQEIDWQAGAQARATHEEDGSRVLQIERLNRDGGLRCTHHFQVFPGQPFVRLWSCLENVSGEPVRVTDGQMLSVAVPARRSVTLFHVEQFSWTYRSDYFCQNQVHLHNGAVPAEIRMGAFPSHFCGPTSCAWAALREGEPDRSGERPQQGLGVVVGIEFNGKSRMRAWAEAGAAHVTSTIDALNHPVDPGDTFVAPACFVGLFEGDWDEAGYVTQRFAEAYVHPPMPDEHYPWMQYNTWGYGQDINETQQLAAIERCAEMGVEVLVLDLGWAVQIGEWRADPAKFPRGLAPIADRAHELGIKFGIHIPLAQANVSSPVVRQHPDWLVHTDNDYFGAAPICLGHRPCREWIIDEIVRLIDEYHIDYIVHDGEDMVKRCTKTTHTHAADDSNYANSTEGLDVVVQTLRARRPHVVWENCEDGGCMLTYKMAHNYHSTITVDNIATYATRQGVYGASYPFSPRYSVRYMQDDPTPYTLRSAIFGGPLILMQKITEWDAEQIEQTKEAIAAYKDLRRLVRDAKIIHLLPPRHNVDGIGWGWDAIQAVSPDQMRSVVMVYRALGSTGRRAICPRGLLDSAAYRVRLADRGEVSVATGDALARDGIELALPELSSEMIYLEEVGM